jgi:hypothetical protein
MYLEKCKELYEYQHEHQQEHSIANSTNKQARKVKFIDNLEAKVIHNYGLIKQLSNSSISN